MKTAKIQAQMTRTREALERAIARSGRETSALEKVLGRPRGSIEAILRDEKVFWELKLSELLAILWAIDLGPGEFFTAALGPESAPDVDPYDLM